MRYDQLAHSIVTGQAAFADDARIPDTLHAKVLRSPYPSARVLRIDTAAARAIPGVVDVLTADTAPPLAGERQVVTDRPRFVGDPVAAVAAVDAQTAEAALRALQVDWEVMPHVADVATAITEDVLVDPGGNVATLGGPRHYPEATVSLERGDVDAEMVRGAYVVEDVVETGYQVHGHLETHCCTARRDDTGRLTVWTTTQNPHSRRHALADLLNEDPATIDVVCPFLGGGYGGKESSDPNEAVYIDAVAIVLADRTGRPVRYRATQRENLSCFSVRSPMTITLRSAVTPDGRILAMDARLVQDTGAYADAGPRTVITAARVLEGSYRLPALRLRGFAVLTHQPVGGKVWGYGCPEITFALEQHLDSIAERVGLPPRAVRTRNVTRPGNPLPGRLGSVGLTYSTASGADALARLEDELRGAGPDASPARMPGASWGEGVRCSVESSGGEGSDALMSLTDDGRLRLSVGLGHMGTGALGAVTTMAAEVLGVPRDTVELEWGTTGTAWDWGGAASRAVHCTGQAAASAAADLRDQIRTLLRAHAACPAADVTLDAHGVSLTCHGHEGCCHLRGSERTLTLTRAEVAHLARSRHWRRPFAGPWYGGRDGRRLEPGETVLTRSVEPHPSTTQQLTREDAAVLGIGYGTRNITRAPWAAQAARVQVDPLSGEVVVDSVTSVIDIGRLIDPPGAALQIAGGSLFGHGFALAERVVHVPAWGLLLATDLRDLGVATAETRVCSATMFLEQSRDAGAEPVPFGLGETGVQVASALATAVRAATGEPVLRLPIAAEDLAHSDPAHSDPAHSDLARTRTHAEGVTAHVG